MGKPKKRPTKPASKEKTKPKEKEKETPINPLTPEQIFALEMICGDDF